MSDDTQNTLEGSAENNSIHLVISRMHDRVWIKPSRPVNRHCLIGMVSDALYMLQAAECKTINPDDCKLRVILAVDEDQDLSD